MEWESGSAGPPGGDNPLGRALVGCAHPGAPLRCLLAPEILFIDIKKSSQSFILIRPFCIMLLYRYLLHYGLLLHIMSQYLCLFSLILQVYIKRENAGSWDSGLEKEQILETYSAQLQKS